jgi:membrane protein involved in colicin uptake
VSVLFGLLNARSNAQLAAAEKRATDEATGRAAAEKALADERKERLEYVEARRIESQAEREELQSIVNDIRMVARTQARGGFRQGPGGSGGGAEGSGETGPQPVRRPGGGRTS